MVGIDARPENGVLSDYQRVGGRPAVTAVVDRFCRMLLGDGQLCALLADRDLRRLKRLHEYLLARELGGPAEEPEPGPNALAGLPISREQLGRLVSYLTLALHDCGVDPEIIARAGPRLAAAEQHVVTQA